MKKKIFCILLMILVSVSLTGCVGKEPNEIAYVVALGIDKNTDDNYDITIQYANTTQISGGSSEEGGKNGSQIVENITVEAPTIYGAISLANHIVSKTFSLSHAKLIVFSSEIAEDGLKDIVETFIRSEELRPDVNLAVAQDSANKYLLSVDPVMEVNPAKYYQLIYDKNTLVGTPDGVAKNFFFSVKTGDYDCIIPLAGVISGEKEESGGQTEEGGGSSGEETEGGGSEKSSGGGQSESGSEETKNEKQKEAPTNDGAFDYKLKNYRAGEASIEQKNKSESMGSAIFLGDKMVGTLGSIETEMCRLLLGYYKNSYLTLYNDQTPNDPVTIKVTQEQKPKYKVDVKNKTVNAELFIDADVYSLPADYNIEKDIVEFEKQSKEYLEESCKTFMTEFIKEYNCDIFRFKEKAKWSFLTNKEYNDYKENVDLRDYEISVKVNFEIRRTGPVVRG